MQERGTAPRRMLCTDCGRTAPAHTWIGGSDVLELVGWLCLVVPGLVYCWWRHACRRKVCAACGSSALVREARAARLPGATPATPGGPPPRRAPPLYARRHLAWLGPPGSRLRHLGGGSAVTVVGVVAWGVLSLDLIEVRPETREPVSAAAAPAPAAPDDAALDAAARARARAAARMEAERGGEAVSVRGVRRRECQRLCTDFHAARSHALRTCVERCVAEDEPDADDPRAARGPTGTDPCAGHPDPVGCRFELGPTSAR